MYNMPKQNLLDAVSVPLNVADVQAGNTHNLMSTSVCVNAAILQS